MKMYIAVIEDVPDYIVPTLVAHSVLNAHFKFQNLDSYNNWLNHSFKKVVLRVSLKEFIKIQELDNIHLGHENKTFNGEPTCIVVCPREDNPKVLTFAKLWKPN